MNTHLFTQLEDDTLEDVVICVHTRADKNPWSASNYNKIFYRKSNKTCYLGLTKKHRTLIESRFAHVQLERPIDNTCLVHSEPNTIIANLCASYDEKEWYALNDVPYPFYQTLYHIATNKFTYLPIKK